MPLILNIIIQSHFTSQYRKVKVTSYSFIKVMSYSVVLLSGEVGSIQDPLKLGCGYSKKMTDFHCSTQKSNKIGFVYLVIMLSFFINHENTYSFINLLLYRYWHLLLTNQPMKKLRRRGKCVFQTNTRQHFGLECCVFRPANASLHMRSNGQKQQKHLKIMKKVPLSSCAWEAHKRLMKKNEEKSFWSAIRSDSQKLFDT